MQLPRDNLKGLWEVSSEIEGILAVWIAWMGVFAGKPALHLREKNRHVGRYPIDDRFSKWLKFAYKQGRISTIHSHH